MPGISGGGGAAAGAMVGIIAGQSHKSQASHMDNPFEMFLPMLHVASIIVAHALSFGVAILLAYSLTGVGGWTLGHRTCSDIRHGWSIVLTGSLALISIIGQAEQLSDTVADVLVRNLRLFFACVVGFSAVFGVMIIWLAIKRIFNKSAWNDEDSYADLPSHRKLCRGDLGLCPLCPLSILLVSAILSWSGITSWTSPYDTEDLEGLMHTIPIILLFLAKAAIFVASCAAVPCLLCCALVLCTAILCGGPWGMELLAEWKRGLPVAKVTSAFSSPVHPVVFWMFHSNRRPSMSSFG